MKQCMIIFAVLATLSTSAFAGQSLSDAFVNGTFKGQAMFLYLAGSDTDVTAAKGSDDKNAGSVAIEGNYLTDDFYGFRLGVGAQAGYDLGFHGEDGSNQDDTRNTVTDVGLQQAFLSYTMDTTSIKAGRQIIKSPLLMNSSAFPLKDSFDAIQVSTKILPETVFKAFLINRWNKRYGSDDNGSVIQEDVTYSDPLLSLYAKNQSITGLTLDGQFLTTNEDDNHGDLPVVTKEGYDQYFARLHYKLPTAFPLFFGAEVGGATFDQDAKDDASFYGVKIGTKLGGANLDASCTWVDDAADYPGTMGHVPDVVLYTNGLLNKSIYAGVHAVALQAKHNFGTKNFSARIKLIHLDQSSEGMEHSAKKIDEDNEINLDFNYTLSGKLEGASLRLFMGYAEYDQDVDEDSNLYARFYLVYKF